MALSRVNRSPDILDLNSLPSVGVAVQPGGDPRPVLDRLQRTAIAAESSC